MKIKQIIKTTVLSMVAVTIIAAVLIAILPRALDQMFYENYDMPVENKVNLEQEYNN